MDEKCDCEDKKIPPSIWPEKSDDNPTGEKDFFIEKSNDNFVDLIRNLSKREIQGESFALGNYPVYSDDEEEIVEEEKNNQKNNYEKINNIITELEKLKNKKI